MTQRDWTPLLIALAAGPLLYGLCWLVWGNPGQTAGPIWIMGCAAAGCAYGAITPPRSTPPPEDPPAP